MSEAVLQASVFKARCLAVLDEVARSRTPVTITKHGKAVARVVPIDAVERPTMGSVTLLGAADEDYFSIGEAWDADS